MSRIDTSVRSKLVEAALTAALFAGIAALFRRTRSNVFDRFVGDLSYPLYISHVFIVSIVAANRWLIAVSAIGATDASRTQALLSEAFAARRLKDSERPINSANVPAAAT
jgi:peptidoglycan/LPS O-acetylase OafA/YrhL